MKLTKLGKRVFTIYNIIIGLIAYIMSKNLGSNQSIIITSITILLYLRMVLSIILIDLINAW